MAALTSFLNVDLDMRSTTPIEPVIAALGDDVIVLHSGREKRAYCAHLELSRVRKDADATIRVFCTLIRALPPDARRSWDKCRARDFNIGIQAECEPRATEIVLKAGTVQAVAELGARIVFTVYAPEGRAKT
jgi:hypothetical protein